MAGTNKHLEVTRQEAGMILAVIFLLSTLMFSVGLWVGFGIGSSPEHVAAHKSSAVKEPTEVVTHERQPSSVEKNSAKAASAAEASNQAGAELRKAYQASKQEALDKMIASHGDGVEGPRSIHDAKAHMAAHKEWNREPTSDLKTDEEKEIEKLRDEEVVRKKEGPPKTVKTLFERNPSAVKDFDPTPGTYTVQLASYATFDEAKNRVIALRKAEVDQAYVSEVKLKNGETWYRVGVGSYPNPVIAKNTGERLIKRRLSGDFVVRQVK